MSMALVFPGQGSQAVGMGKALASDFAMARGVFEEIDAALGQKLSRLMFEGPESELTLTANAQPALMAVSLAALRVLESEAGRNVARDANFAAGHSLGEYSALAATSALTIADTARLLRLRGEAMQKAVPVGMGAMAALLDLDYETGVSVAQEASAEQDDRDPVLGRVLVHDRQVPHYRRRQVRQRWRAEVELFDEPYRSKELREELKRNPDFGDDFCRWVVRALRGRPRARARRARLRGRARPAYRGDGRNLFAAGIG